MPKFATAKKKYVEVNSILPKMNQELLQRSVKLFQTKKTLLQAIVHINGPSSKLDILVHSLSEEVLKLYGEKKKFFEMSRELFLHMKKPPDEKKKFVDGEKKFFKVVRKLSLRVKKLPDEKNKFIDGKKKCSEVARKFFLHVKKLSDRKKKLADEKIKCLFTLQPGIKVNVFPE